MGHLASREPVSTGINAAAQNPLDALDDHSLLIVDDDTTFCMRLGRAMERQGYSVHTAHGFADGIAAVEVRAPAFAIIDMRLGDGNGLDLIARLKTLRPDARGVILTGYANIATAVTAVKLGAFDYLAKPTDAEELHHALTAEPDRCADLPENPMSFDRVRWEYVQRAYERCGRNTTRAAQHLAMPRRTLQGILRKRAPI